MRLMIAAVGRLKRGPERALFEHYCQRLESAGRSVALGPLRLEELAEGRAASAEQRRSDEAQRLLRAAGDAEVRVALDERGTSLASADFAGWLKTKRDAGNKAMAFLIGGPDGQGVEVRSRAGLVLSLGVMTLTHGLARIVLVEQLYRAATIIAGHPYHRA